MLTVKEKEKHVKKYGSSPEDTGSPEVQIAILTNEIKLLTEHFKVHKKDNHSKRGLYERIAKRKSLLKYLRDNDYDRYEKIVSGLEIRHLKG